jgi:hypothetical protein
VLASIILFGSIAVMVLGSWLGQRRQRRLGL